VKLSVLTAYIVYIYQAVFSMTFIEYLQIL